MPLTNTDLLAVYREATSTAHKLTINELKSFVGDSFEIPSAETPPSGATPGELWFNETDGRLYYYYDDGNTEQWVDANPAGSGGSDEGASVVISDTAPSNPSEGDLWWDSSTDSGKLYIYYTDADSSQWVETSPSSGGGGGGNASDLQSVTDAGNTTTNGATFGDGNIELSADGTASFKAGDVNIDNEGRLLLGTSASPTATSGVSAKAVIQGYTGTPQGSGHISLQRGQAATAFGAGNELGVITFGDNTGASFALIGGFSDADSGANNYPGRLVFSTCADGGSDPLERMYIDSNGDVKIGGILPSTPKIQLNSDGSASYASGDLTITKAGRLNSTEVNTYGTAGFIANGTNNTSLDWAWRGSFNGANTSSIDYNGNAQFAGVLGVRSETYPAGNATEIHPNGLVKIGNPSVGSPVSVFEIYASDVFSPGGKNVGILTDGSAEFAGPVKIGGTADANEISEYEEGTWTPNVGGNATYAYQGGSYTKIGRVVIAKFEISITTLGTGLAERIENLPFSVTGADGECPGAVNFFTNLAFSAASVLPYATANTTRVHFNTITAGGSSAANLNTAIFQDGARVAGSVTYFTD